MSSTKSRHLAVPFGIALLAGVAAAHAANVATLSFAAAIAPAPSSTPASTGGAPAHPVAHAESHPETHPVVASPTIAPAASTAATASRVTDEAAQTGAIAAASVPVVTAVAGDTHLTLHDIDELARSKLTRALRGDGDTPASGAAVTLKTPVPAAPVAAPAPMVQPFVARDRTTPVTFVGAYTDSAGQHVLYQFNGAVYPARVGEKLLNGWIARRVDGLSVVVAQGKHSWSVPMSGGTQESTGSPYIAGSALGDLSSPLPPGVSFAQPIARFGR